MTVVSTDNSEHYTWGNQCSGWHLQKSPGLSVIQEYVPPGAAEVRHYHQQAEQFFYVLAGLASLEVEKEILILSVGQGLHIPAGCVHRLSNPGPEPLEFLVISTPPSHGDRVDL